MTALALVVLAAATNGIEARCDGATLAMTIDGVGVDVTPLGMALRASGQGGVALERQRRIELTTPDLKLVYSGKRVEACAPGRRSCDSLGELGFEPAIAIGGPLAWLLAGGGNAPGLYRVTRDAPTTPQLLAAGTVQALCGGELGLAVVGEAPQVVLASPDTPALVSWSVAEVLATALQGDAPLPSLLRAAGVLAAREPGLAAVIGQHMAGDAAPDRRTVAAYLVFADVKAAASTAAIWLLGHDPAPVVRRAAFDALLTRCPKLSPNDCDALAALFVDDVEPDIAWRARDALLERAPEVALHDAPLAYRLDAVALLAARVDRFGIGSVRAALRVLAMDADDEVRRAALRLDGQSD